MPDRGGVNSAGVHSLHRSYVRVVQPTEVCDPLLLKHLRGDLYAELAAWDLTEDECAVMVCA